MKIKKKGDLIFFYCPGCGNNHCINSINDDTPSWSWNGSFDYPTFSPSILIKNGHYGEGYNGKDCWCNLKERTGIDSGFKCGICHSFVTDGKIHYLEDCTHSYAGKIIDLQDIE